MFFPPVIFLFSEVFPVGFIQIFCKYLSFYIEERCQRYYEKCKEKEVAISCGKTKQELEPYKRAEQIAFAELDVLKNLSVLKAFGRII